MDEGTEIEKLSENKLFEFLYIYWVTIEIYIYCV